MIEKLEGQELSAASTSTGELATERFQSEGAAMEMDRIAGADPSPTQTQMATEPVEAIRESVIAVDPTDLRGAIEALLFSVPEPIAIRSLAEVLGVSVHEARSAVEELRLEYIDLQRAFRIEDIAGGVQLLTVPKFDPWIRKLRQKEKESRLTPAALETLAVIAYKQPISKADLEGIRGVGCGPTLKTVLERGLIQVVGRGEGLGKPLLYGTTKRFLESFAISSVRELPQPELLDRPPGVVAPPSFAALPPPPMAGINLPEGSVPDAEPTLRRTETDVVESSLLDASGPLS